MAAGAGTETGSSRNGLKAAGERDAPCQRRQGERQEGRRDGR